MLQLQNNLVFLLPGVVEVVEEGMLPHVNLHETIIVTIELHTSNISLHDTRDLGTARYGPCRVALFEKVNKSLMLSLGGLMRQCVNVCGVLFPPQCIFMWC